MNEYLLKMMSSAQNKNYSDFKEAFNNHMENLLDKKYEERSELIFKEE